MADVLYVRPPLPRLLRADLFSAAAGALARSAEAVSVSLSVCPRRRDGLCISILLIRPLFFALAAAAASVLLRHLDILGRQTLRAGAGSSRAYHRFHRGHERAFENNYRVVRCTRGALGDSARRSPA